MRKIILVLLTNLTVSLAIAQPSNDDPCSAIVLTPSVSCSYATYTNAAATASVGMPVPGCASYSGGDVWFRVTVPASGTVIVDTQTGVMTDSGMAMYTGTCSSLALLECDDDDSPNGLMSSITRTGLTPGSTVWIRFWEYGNNNNGTFGICVTLPPPPPTNDDPCSAQLLSVNVACSYSTYTTGGATATTGVTPPGCASYSGSDVWFRITVPANGTVVIDTQTGVIFDSGMAVYTGSNCSALTLLECDDDDSPNGSMSSITRTGLVPGSTLWIRFWEYGNDNNGSFGICATMPPPPPVNDNCNNATPVTMSTSTCASVSGYISGATASTQANGCGGTPNDDVWYSFVATANNAVVTLSNISGSTTDLYHSVYAGTCGAPGTALICSDPNSSSIPGLIIGNTYFVRVYSWSSSSGATATFDICILGTGPCGTPNNQDYCMAPAVLTQGPGSFSANTSGSYTSDTPGNLNSVFCGSIENNSWYSFIATSTTHTFNFSNITNCNNNYGVQAQVYNVTQDANGCCLNFSSQSNCYNPGTTAVGTVTATGLTIGVEYYLMVDGNAGDVCSFTVTGWTAVGIIPLSVDLVNFQGMTLPQSNQLSWKTMSEQNNDHFQVQRSYDGINFDVIGTVNGNGNSTVARYYNFEDSQVRTGIVYYRLNQVDFDGKAMVTDIIKLDRLSDEEGLVSIYPNPTNQNLNVELNISDNSAQSILEIINLNGTILFSELIDSGRTTQSLDVSNLVQGVYFIRLSDTENGVSIKQFIKK